jgi:hypothetical protein
MISFALNSKYRNSLVRASHRLDSRVCGPQHQLNGPTASLTLSCCLHYPDRRIRLSPPHAIEAEGPHLVVAVPICHSLSRRRPWRLAPWWPFLSRQQRSLSFPFGGASASPMDSTVIPFLPPQWWQWQQAASPLPPIVTAGGALPPRGSRSSSRGSSRACGRVQSMAVMRSTASCPPWLVARSKASNAHLRVECISPY